MGVGGGFLNAFRRNPAEAKSVFGIKAVLMLVRPGSRLMTCRDIYRGHLILGIRLAPLKPAEFVRFIIQRVGRRLVPSEVFEMVTRRKRKTKKMKRISKDLELWSDFLKQLNTLVRRGFILFGTLFGIGVCVAAALSPSDGSEQESPRKEWNPEPAEMCIEPESVEPCYCADGITQLPRPPPTFSDGSVASRSCRI